MLSKFGNKDAQKSSIFSSKASIARSLILFPKNNTIQYLICFCLLGFYPLPAETFSSEVMIESGQVRIVEAHLILKDTVQACQVAKKALSLYPQSPLVYEVYLRALSDAGDEKELLSIWKVYRENFPEAIGNKELVEDIAWGVLDKASKSSSLPIRQLSLLAAFFSQDRKGVCILEQGMCDPNYRIRAFSVKLAGHLRDQKLIDRVKKMFFQEEIQSVRKELMLAIGSMKIKSLEKELKIFITSEECSAAEKSLAIAALVEMRDEANRDDLKHLIENNRAGLRVLAAKVIAYFQSERDVDFLLLLAKDSHSEVRVAAFQALGQIHLKGAKEFIVQTALLGLEDLNEEVAITAAWLLTRHAKKEGLTLFDRLCQSKNRATRLLAVAALSRSGSYATPLMQKIFHTQTDKIVRLNLAIGLIQQHVDLEEALSFLKQCFVGPFFDKLTKIDFGFFEAISDSTLSTSNDLLMSPEMENQFIRLELLSLLAAHDVESAQEAIKSYLTQRQWGITTSAAALLLTEGDSSAVAIIEELLQDSRASVRFQAALVLSMWGREENVIKILEDEYPKGAWEIKAKILESMGRIGSLQSIPFLVEALYEEAQTLRLIAAVAIIQTLNH